MLINNVMDVKKRLKIFFNMFNIYWKCKNVWNNLLKDIIDG